MEASCMFPTYPEGGDIKRSTPYTRSPEEISKLIDLLSPCEAVVSHEVNDEFDSLAIYLVDSCDDRADIGRSLEAKIFIQDYGYSSEFIESHFSLYDQNSFFFLMFKTNNENDKVPIGALRVIDISKGGPSETHAMFEEFHEGLTLPDELQVSAEKRVWDIFTVVVDQDYRNGINSVWLYHALYKHSIRQGIDKWISNITPNEIKNLRSRIGIPFRNVSGCKLVSDTTPNGSEVKYGFYYLNVAEIEPEVLKKISEYERVSNSDEVSSRENRMARLLADIARIGLSGSSRTGTA